jgi:hypothetical protein
MTSANGAASEMTSVAQGQQQVCTHMYYLSLKAHVKASGCLPAQASNPKDTSPVNSSTYSTKTLPGLQAGSGRLTHTLHSSSQPVGGRHGAHVMGRTTAVVHIGRQPLRLREALIHSHIIAVAVGQAIPA